MSGSFVVATVGRPRLGWLEAFVQAANNGSLPFEIRKCLGVADLFAQLDSGTALSAVVFDAGSPGLDRDVIVRLHVRAIAVLVVTDPHVLRDWHSLGCDAVLSPDFRSVDLLDVLSTHAAAVPRPALRFDMPEEPESVDGPWAGSLITVIGSGGSGVSTVAMAIAQGLGGSGDHQRVALVDLALCAEQGVLHDADPDSAGLLELLDHCRLNDPDTTKVYDYLLPVHKRGYDLLLGLRRRRLWTQLRPASAAVAMRALRGAYAYVVADVDCDLEGEDVSGSADLEDRHQLTRLAVHNASLIVAVGNSSMKGLHSLTRTIRDLTEYGVDPNWIQPVFNLAPSGARARAGYTAALAELTTGLGLAATPVFLPSRDIDERIRSLRPLPSAVVDPLVGAVTARLRSVEQESFPEPLRRIRPGFLSRGVRAS